MANIRNPNSAIVKEPEAAGVRIERKETGVRAAAQASETPTTAGAADKKANPPKDPFPARQSDARQVAGKTPRPTDKPGE